MQSRIGQALETPELSLAAVGGPVGRDPPASDVLCGRVQCAVGTAMLGAGLNRLTVQSTNAAIPIRCTAGVVLAGLDFGCG